jgi:diadenosine tetraphosphatase ApaH/serine/threonine PP2A family protein phosphatase
MTEHEPDTLERDRVEPRRVALVSDVHGNLPAFEAVIADIRETGVDEVWCLGDLIGYGAQPDECVALARESCDHCLIGNHDLVVIDKLDISDFSFNAAAAANWTRENVASETVEWLNGLAPADTTRPLGLYHASPRDPVWEYVLSAMLADLCMDEMEPRVGAVGHSHVALYFWRTDTTSASGELAPGGTEFDLSSGRWIVNPGSVGQPRDGDPRAAWMLLDLERWVASWRRVDYEIDRAAEAIRRAGLPPALAERLYYGQ